MVEQVRSTLHRHDIFSLFSCLNNPQILPKSSSGLSGDYLGIIEIIQGLLRLSRDYPDLFYVFKVCSHVCMHLASGSTLPNVVRARWLVPFDLT